MDIVNRISSAQAATLLETGDEIVLLNIFEIKHFRRRHPL
jgi:hypothetical protein